VEDYDPVSIQLQAVKSRVSAATWRQRVAQARADEVLIQKVLSAEDSCGSLNEALARHLPRSRRSWALRRIPKYREHGFEALIDSRTPREPRMSRLCGQTLQAARSANPSVSVEQALEILREQKITPLPSASTVKREFKRVDDHRRYAQGKERAAHDEVELRFAGGELLLAAEAETGGMAALTASVVELAEQAKLAGRGQVPAKDVGHRDRRGQFTVTYNRLRRRKRGEDIATYLRPAAEKAQGRVPTWPRFVHEQPHTLDAKVRMLTLGWLMAETKGWAALRAPDAAGLETLTGFAYMPSTLAKMVSALAISGAGMPLLEAVGQHWHEVAQKHFGEPGAMAAIYIDNHAKEVWSSLLTQSGKVSHRNRVMPCITTTYAHTGAGTPVVLSVQSGAAPLAPRLVELVEEAEEVVGTEVERAVVIDAEGSTFDLLESFSQRQRVLITPLRPSRAPELELSYTPGSYYRPYRDQDELRVAHCKLTHKSTARTLVLGAILVRRQHRESDTVLLTNGLELGFEGRDLADLYFRRWPVQENAFKEGAALGLDEHRGNCGRMVANVAVVSELEKMASRSLRAEKALAALHTERAALSSIATQATKAEERTQHALAIRRRRLDTVIASGKTSGKGFARVALEHQQALVRAEAATATATKARRRDEQSQIRTAKLEQQLAEIAVRRRHLEPQRCIRQLDVAQDRILTATKLTAAQLINFALREYVPVMPMTPATFVSRVFPLRGRKVIEQDTEHVIFYENPRDPEVSAALQDACNRLNKRALHRGGRRLRYAVEPAPHH
jgi:hypothetical protein